MRMLSSGEELGIKSFQSTELMNERNIPRKGSFFDNWVLIYTSYYFILIRWFIYMNLSVFYLLIYIYSIIHNYLRTSFKLFIFVSNFLIASSCCTCVLLWVSRIYDKFYMFFSPFNTYAYNYSRFYFCFRN